ncbi:MAG: F0F1 ATP synthase subunit alpha [Alphaproteobacteria bacterium]|nr:F0F1 ATP synthase subunit alpha [Alphaproteobacteria bacterium]
MAELADVVLDLAPRVTGHVVRVADGVATVQGLRDIGSDELVRLDDGALGMALELAPDHTGVVLLTDADHVRVGQGVRALGRLPDVPTGPGLLGRVLDPVGRALDGRPAPTGPRRPAYAPPPDLLARAAVDRPLHTGITALDAAIPIGRGQRQLVVGDHNTGRTALAVDIVVAQRHTGVRCVVVVVGSPMSRVLALRDTLARADALDHTVIVAAEAHATPGLQVLAPAAGMAVAEGFRDAGDDVLVVFDDLTKHADAWRELALLLGRPPGREAFPGDIFYLHAELLERAAPLRDGGSITALPLVETTDGDLSSYIPTNLISITDGQVVLDAARFDRNERPAIDIGRSVSRIGGTAQRPVMRQAARDLRIALARATSLEALTRVGLDVDPQTARALQRGRLLRALLRQERLSPRELPEQVLTLVAVDAGAWDDTPPDTAPTRLGDALRAWRALHPDDHAALAAGDTPAEGWRQRWLDVVAPRRA